MILAYMFINYTPGMFLRKKSKKFSQKNMTFFNNKVNCPSVYEIFYKYKIFRKILINHFLKNFIYRKFLGNDL